MAEYAGRLGKTGRTEDGAWISPFDPQEPYYNFMMKEASGWSTLWLVPHDVQGLINLLGGREAFDRKLDQFFSTPYTPKGICRDCTGLIGQILAEMYGSDASGYGYPGMDDQGATSSWYALSAMGFYPVDPSSDNYIIGSPLFDHVKLQMSNGENLEIVARNNSTENMYIQTATINGKPWSKPWFSQTDIKDGAVLVLTMGPHPNPSWGSAPDAMPPSMTSRSN